MEAEVEFVGLEVCLRSTPVEKGKEAGVGGGGQVGREGLAAMCTKDSASPVGCSGQGLPVGSLTLGRNDVAHPGERHDLRPDSSWQLRCSLKELAARGCVLTMRLAAGQGALPCRGI